MSQSEFRLKMRLFHWSHQLIRCIETTCRMELLCLACFLCWLFPPWRKRKHKGHFASVSPPRHTHTHTVVPAPSARAAHCNGYFWMGEWWKQMWINGGLCKCRKKHAVCGLQGSLRTNKCVMAAITGCVDMLLWKLLCKIVEVILALIWFGLQKVDSKDKGLSQSLWSIILRKKRWWFFINNSIWWCL